MRSTIVSCCVCQSYGNFRRISSWDSCDLLSKHLTNGMWQKNISHLVNDWYFRNINWWMRFWSSRQLMGCNICNSWVALRVTRNRQRKRPRARAKVLPRYLYLHQVWRWNICKPRCMLELEDSTQKSMEYNLKLCAALRGRNWTIPMPLS